VILLLDGGLWEGTLVVWGWRWGHSSLVMLLLLPIVMSTASSIAASEGSLVHFHLGHCIFKLGPKVFLFAAQVGVVLEVESDVSVQLFGGQLPQNNYNHTMSIL
jgi:hypothetical protein